MGQVETPPLDKDRILGIAKSSGLENPDFTSAVNYLRGEGAQSIPPDIKKIMEDSKYSVFIQRWRFFWK
jgi:hypothetical protein